MPSIGLWFDCGPMATVLLTLMVVVNSLSVSATISRVAPPLLSAIDGASDWGPAAPLDWKPNPSVAIGGTLVVMLLLLLLLLVVSS
uniref:Uncharacterized protein n=1 Tax=Anopheles darlingi TaxID=43151 RepID=A0A2M4DA01_ANODA